MSDGAVQPGSSGPWQPLNTNERRVLGVLIEKQKTLGSDAYPMSLNAMVTGCNQKSNRDPVMELEEDDVEEALMACKARGLTSKVIGGRVERWRHLLYEAWNIVDKVEMAVLGELLLRGPQTEGELRTRASRMDPIEDLDALRKVLRRLVERNLVVYLTEEDRRGAMLTHGFHEKTELARLQSRLASAVTTRPDPQPTHAPTPAPAPPPPRSDSRLDALEAKLSSALQELEASRRQTAALEKELGELRQAMAATRQELAALKQSLGC
jgi:uncharacterized protein